ncbi:MAG: hypothetical protein SPG34_01155, partial [Trueperella sp.]|uniref:hypothetical protein n=1 Tax=Trueperella sp. TaxID=2699835 RepID=UPI002A90EEFC
RIFRYTKMRPKSSREGLPALRSACRATGPAGGHSTFEHIVVTHVKSNNLDASVEQQIENWPGNGRP